MKTIDTFILSICTKISHALQRATGLTCYFIAKIGIAISTLDLIVETLNYFYKFLHFSTTVFGLVILTLCLLTMIHRSIVCSKAEDHLWSGRLTRPAELLPYSESILWRILWVALFLIDIFCAFLGMHKYHHIFLEVVSQCFFSLGLIIFYYFIAVNPLPPGMSKLRKWINNFSQVLTPVKNDV